MRQMSEIQEGAATRLVEDAMAFAARAHHGVNRKGNGQPYILHPMEVAVICGSLGADREVLAAALLHDTVEDSDATMEEIQQRFGARVAALVASETEDKREGLPPEETWRIRKEETLEKLRRAEDPGVRILWLGDKLSNIRSLYRLWKREGDRTWDYFHQKDPAQQAWYYRSIARELKPLADTEAYLEFFTRVETIFKGVTERGTSL